MSTAH